MKSALSLTAICLSLFIATPAFAASGHDAHNATAAPAASAAATSEGTVKKVDKAAGRLTIAHGPLKNLDMPPMTMAFRVSDASLMDKVKVGDRIRFVAENADGTLTVKALEPDRGR
ncbi:MAG: copper-binding protein [Proteobacteria bacterium]|nr:copper-binding protein [Pseudomonadota bacterium]MBS0554552.1 copper-binding protein [Pseudomonadota bacterium]